jgi:glucan phosphoethanolaminetransferase (alkaline phosphatase superfamily)
VKSNDTPAFNALLLLLVLLGFNILTAMSVIRYFFNFEISKNFVYSFGLVLYFILLFIGFKTLFGKQNEICKRYENETKEERRKGTIYLLLYIVLSVVLFFILGKPLK